MKYKILLSLFIFFSFAVNCFSQTKDSIASNKDSAKIEISGYVDAYYGYYTDSAGAGNYQKFPSISPRSNQFGLNVAMITAKYSADKVRGIVAVHYGDIPHSTWSANYNFIQEANVGIRLQKTLWLDAGFFRTHLGTEALFPKENYTSSVSVPTFFEPYYEAGARLNYIPNEKLSFFIYALNGYNIYEDNNRTKSTGLLVTYIFSERLNIGYSGYYGDDTPENDSLKHFRQMHNVFLNFKRKKFKFTMGGDYCMQQNSDTSGKKSVFMFSGLAMLKYQLMKKFGVYNREEIFNDPQGIMSGTFVDKTGKRSGYKIWGVTLGIEYKPTDNSYIRLEGRELIADKDQEIFHWNNFITNARTELMINMGVSF
ncbi:MAG: porin [Bacteroidetes bacterium]|nr:porin [Bacteroidota bacterium]